MLARVRAKSQITLPKQIVKKMGLSVGDAIDISVRDGGIFIVPVTLTRTRNEKEYKLADIR